MARRKRRRKGRARILMRVRRMLGVMKKFEPIRTNWVGIYITRVYDG
jgi:hypothetical protein